MCKISKRKTNWRIILCVIILLCTPVFIGLCWFFTGLTYNEKFITGIGGKILLISGPLLAAFLIYTRAVILRQRDAGKT